MRGKKTVEMRRVYTYMTQWHIRQIQRYRTAQRQQPDRRSQGEDTDDLTSNAIRGEAAKVAAIQNRLAPLPPSSTLTSLRLRFPLFLLLLVGDQSGSSEQRMRAHQYWSAAIISNSPHPPLLASAVAPTTV